ncbi:hypothetical protein BDW22DRAFT_666377 [Trametopsis cervina]|nr:hypothetical protein BDW22DRAFT_666377 [Trametopsis cervina]
MTKNLPNFLKIFRLFTRIGTLTVKGVTTTDLNAWADPDSRLDTYPPSIFPQELRVEKIVGHLPVRLWHHLLLRTSTIQQQSLVAVHLHVSSVQVQDIGAFLNAGGLNVRSLEIDVCFLVNGHSDLSHINNMDLSGCKSLERVTLRLPDDGGHSIWRLANGIVASLPGETVTHLTFNRIGRLIWGDMEEQLTDGLQLLRSLLSRFPVLKEVALIDMNSDDIEVLRSGTSYDEFPDPIRRYKEFIEGLLLTDPQRKFQLLYKAKVLMDLNFP